MVYLISGIPGCGNACEFSSHGVCHNSASSPKKHQDKEAWFLWYNLCLASCTAPLVASLMASVWSVEPRLVLPSAQLQHALQRQWHLDFLGTALWAFENMGFNEVKLATCFHRQPSCSLIRLNQNFYFLSTSKGNKKTMSELAQEVKLLPAHPNFWN